jgi:hypothetical protein
MQPRAIPGFNQSLSVNRGPLVFSYPIGETWLKLRDRNLTADWQVYPNTQWNYALAVDNPNSIHTAEHPVTGAPFTHEGAPVTITLPARKLKSWQAVDSVADPVPPSPVTTAEPLEQITLIPYAAAKLRITAFPHCAQPQASTES